MRVRTHAPHRRLRTRACWLGLAVLALFFGCSSDRTSNSTRGCQRQACTPDMDAAPLCEVPTNQPPCVPLSGELICKRNGKNCGEYTGDNGCGFVVSVDCGSCREGLECGETQSNVCSCPCYIEGQCYPQGAIDPDDHCQICDTHQAGREWTVKEDCTAEITAGTDFVCTRQRDGLVDCGGPGRHGATMVPDVPFESISAGEQHVCGIRMDGRVRCWGSDTYGQSSPPDGLVARRLSAGRRHTCAVDRSNELHCWGENAYGQLDARDVNFFDVVAAKYHSCGIDDRFRLRCWGWGAGVDGIEPPDDKVSKVSAGERHTCALRRSGHITCWGSDWWGESTAPPGRFDDVDAGEYRTCAIDEFNRILCWGQGFDGVESHACRIFTDVSVGSSICALDRQGNRYCWRP